MNEKTTLPRILVGILAGILLPTIFGNSLPAQTESPRSVIVLPPASAGTALSTQIQSEAEYLVARGSLVESVAIARKINADAFAQEIQNSVDYVDAFFQRRALNRQWRAEENPNRLEQEKKSQEIRKMRIKEQFQDVLKNGDTTAQLNWLLTELSGPTLALHYVAGKVSYKESDESKPTVEGSYIAGDIPLDDNGTSRMITSSEVALIRFSDGHATFVASDPEILKAEWPFALRDEKFDDTRKLFQKARESLMQDLRKDGHAGAKNGEKLIQSLNGLLESLEKAYPQKDRTEPTVFLRYNAAKRYLQTLATEAHHAIQEGDRSIADGAVRFQGGSVLDLIRHMDRSGLAFAPPTPGGERVYRSLLNSMRSLYMTLGK